MPIEVPLTQGKVALIDETDAPAVLAFRWYAVRSSGKLWYAARFTRKGGAGRVILMHRAIIGAAAGQNVDHRDGNGLNNCRYNLRLCTTAQNASNAGPWPKRSPTASRYKGVSFVRPTGRWQVSIRSNGIYRHLGTFKTQEDAARAYNAAALKYHGEFAKLNEVPNGREQGAGEEPAEAVSGGGVPAADQGAELRADV